MAKQDGGMMLQALRKKRLERMGKESPKTEAPKPEKAVSLESRVSDLEARVEALEAEESKPDAKGDE